MVDHALREIDFAGHHRRFARWLGEGRVGACDREGRLIWASDGASDSPTARTLARLNREGFVWECDGAGFKHQVLDAGDAIVCVPIRAPDAATAVAGEAQSGWLVLLGSQGHVQLPSAGDVAAEALRELASAVHDEHALRREMDFLAGKLSERYEELHLVYNIDAHIRNFVKGWDAFQGLVELCARHLDVDIAAFITPNEKFTISATNLSKPVFNLDLVLVEMRGDLFRFVQASRESIAINDRDDPRRGYIFTDMPYKVLACPILVDRAVSAILVLVKHDDKPDFSASERRLAEVTANQFSNLMHMSRAMEDMKSFNKQMIDALIEAVEAKDPYTRGHSERVSAIACDIGAQLGLAADEIDTLRWSALLHDVGKIGIPDAVLCKPGPLTRDEFTFITVHPERGCEILGHIDGLAHVIPAVRHHHERIDGKGYPHGLAGAAIPLAGRIIAVADTYDSITSSRAYRPGRSHEEAVVEIQRVRGTQLDAAAVDAFVQVCEAAPAWIHEFRIQRKKLPA